MPAEYLCLNLFRNRDPCVEPRGTAAVRSAAEEGHGRSGAATGKREAEICVHVVTAPPTRVRGLEIGIRLWLGDRSAWGSEIGVLV